MVGALLAAGGGGAVPPQVPAQRGGGSWGRGVLAAVTGGAHVGAVLALGRVVGGPPREAVPRRRSLRRPGGEPCSWRVPPPPPAG